MVGEDCKNITSLPTDGEVRVIGIKEQPSSTARLLASSKRATLEEESDFTKTFFFLGGF